MTLPEHYRVIANFGAAVAALDSAGQVHQAVPLTKLPQLVAGDRVLCEKEGETAGLRVTSLLERDGVLSRIDRRGQPKPLAANVSHLAIVSASKPGIDALLIDQFCIAAELAGIEAMVVINKSDLLEDEQHQQCVDMLDVYRAIGYSAVLIDTKTEGKTCNFVWIVASRFKDIWVNHTATTELEPFLFPRPRVRPPNCKLSPRFNKWEVRWLQFRFSIFTKQSSCHLVNCTL